MITLYYGDDSDKRIQAVNAHIHDIVSEYSDTAVARFDETNWSPHTILSYTESAGLFGTMFIVVIDRVCDDGEKLDFILTHIDRFTTSTNQFIFSETKILKDILKKFENTGASIHVYSKTKQIQQKNNDAFLIANAFGLKDKKKTWTLYVQQIEQGESPEAISGMLFWKIKSMLSSGRISPYTKDELTTLSSKIVSIYHNARISGEDLAVSLEQFILKSL